ncbi:hypothetical protein [Thiothrix subterranea]|nr:hypothetical protein [Thiothrix subterranea]
MREMLEISVRRDGEFIYLDLVANAFLHHMVRNIAGSLLMVGAEERPVAWMAELLAQRNRALAGMTAPASGLYFVHVDYPERFGLASDYHLPRFIL